MLPIRMESKDRYYTMHFTYDMLGDAVLVCDHGGKHSNHHRRIIKVVESEATAEQLAEDIIKIRHKRGYDVVEAA